MPQLWQCLILNPLSCAEDQTCASAAIQATAETMLDPQLTVPQQELQTFPFFLSFFFFFLKEKILNCIFIFLLLFLSAPSACRSSQARDWTHAVAAT